jgi:hypothetical protein
MKLLGTISVGSDVADQRPIRFFCIHKILEEKNGSTMRQYMNCSVRREILYNILIEFGVPMKLFRQIHSEDVRTPSLILYVPFSTCIVANLRSLHNV